MPGRVRAIEFILESLYMGAHLDLKLLDPQETRGRIAGSELALEMPSRVGTLRDV